MNDHQTLASSLQLLSTNRPQLLNLPTRCRDQQIIEEFASTPTIPWGLTFSFEYLFSSSSQFPVVDPDVLPSVWVGSVVCYKCYYEISNSQWSRAMQ